MIQREIGVLEQVLGAGGVLGKHRDADRRAHGERFLANFHRAVEQSAQLLPDQARFRGVVDVLAQHDELVAAEPRDQRMRRHFELQLLRRDAQNLVADRVTVNVVDVLEVIEIDPDHGAAPARGGRIRDGLAQARAHQLAVRQRRERIVMRQERDARLGMFAFSDVAEFEQARRAFAIRDRARRDLDRDRFAPAIGDVGIQAQFAVAEQPIDHVGVGDERGDHQMLRLVPAIPISRQRLVLTATACIPLQTATPSSSTSSSELSRRASLAA